MSTLFLNWANKDFSFIYSVYKFKFVSERTGEKPVCMYMTISFMFELSSLASFRSWASILLSAEI